MAIQPNETGNSASFGDSGAGRTGTTGTTGTGSTSGLGSATTDIGEDSRARDIALQARERAGEFVEQYTDRARSGIEDTMTRAASELGTVADALRQCSDSNTTNNAMLLPYVNQVADQVDRLSQFLETRRVDDLARDVESFARRNPAVFLGACFGVGILAARFLKASRGEYGGATFSDTGHSYNTGYTPQYSPSYKTADHRSATSTDGGWVAYGEATYTEPDTGSRPDRAGYDAQRSTAGDGSVGLGNNNDVVNGGGASYSGPLRGTQGTIPSDNNR